MRIKWLAFPLHPETPEEGQRLEDLFAGQPVDIPAMLAQLRQVAEELGLPFGNRTKTFNSRLAQEVGKWAEDQGKDLGNAFHHAAFLAYFQRGENIAQQSVLLEICESVGLDPHAAKQVLEQRTHRHAVDEDWDRSRKMGIRAVPTFVLNGQRLVGAQSYEALEKMVLAAGVRRRH